MADSNRNDPNGSNPNQNGSGNNYEYHYGYTSKGSGHNSSNTDASGGSSGKGYRYKYNYNYTPGNSQASRSSNNGFGDWIGIIILFCVSGAFPPLAIIAIIWLVRKLRFMDTAQKEKYRREAQQAANRVKQDVEHAFRQENAQAQTKSDPGATARQSASKSKKTAAAKSKQATQVRAEAGTGLMIGGGILTAIFGLGTVATFTEFLESLFYGYFFADELVGVLACAIFLCGGLTMLFSGIRGKRRSERYLNYLAYIGSNQKVDLARMAASFDVPVKKLCRDLRRMLAKGILPTGYLDLAEGKLFLTEAGYQAPEPAPESDPQPEEIQEDDILRQIRQVNDEIPDEAMSAKIDRIEEITGKILAYQKSHPNREGQLRSFLNYYLPTTLKILRAYAQLDAQGIEGENISAAKARIEGMMDQVVAGFEKQLDKLFQDDAMDITSDVQVLENMLKKDGLSDDQNMTMTM